MPTTALRRDAVEAEQRLWRGLREADLPWRVVRVHNHDLLRNTDGVLAEIARVLAAADEH